jgi:uroporphyrinogen-III synthase
MINLEEKRILVTREAAGAKIFGKKIAAAGGIPIITPLLQINCLPINDETASSLELDTYEWVFFTSKNGVDCFLQDDRFREALARCNIAAVGPKTEKALENQGYSVQFVPSTFNAEVMASEFLLTFKETGPVLLVRGTLASPVLPQAFSKAGRSFTTFEVYETVSNEEIKNTLQTALQDGIDLLTFTSPSTIDAFIELAEERQTYIDLPAACIGTTTENHAKEKGFQHTIVPTHFTIEGMLEAMSDYFQGKGGYK